MKLIYLSMDDLMLGEMLLKSEKLINKMYEEKINLETEINIVLECHNAYKYFCRGDRLLIWSSDYYEKLKYKIESIEKETKKYFNLIGYENIYELFLKVDSELQETFFEILDCNNNFKKISNDNFQMIITDKNCNPSFILENQKIVKQFSEQIVQFLLNDFIFSTELLINKYAIVNLNDRNIYIPDNLTNEQVTEIFNKYLLSPYLNLNYVRVIAKFDRLCDKYKITDELALLAEDKIIELQNKIFDSSSSNGINYGFKVSCVKDLESEFKYEIKNNIHDFKYSLNWIKENPDCPTLLNNFIYIFQYVDNQMRVQLVNKSYEEGIFEKIKIKLRRAYNPNFSFFIKEKFSYMQFVSYYNCLKSNKISLEKIIEWFFQNYLLKEFNIKNFSISIPSNKSNYLEKCRNTLPEIEFVLKEFKEFVTRGYIDKRIIERGNKPIIYEDVPSLLENKYFYLSDCDDVKLIIHYMFSNQCMLTYPQNYDEKFRNFYHVLSSNKIKISDYKKFNMTSIQFLLDKNIIKKTNDDVLKMNDDKLIYILFDLYKNGVCNYYKLEKDFKNTILKLKQLGYITFDSTLFSKDEIHYLNYYMNDREFIDGHDLRNSNLHGTQIGDKKSSINKSRYMQILKILILIIIKINDDVCTYYDLKSNKN